jgi:hypothetical protein
LVGEWNVTAQTLDTSTTASNQGITISSNTKSYGKDFNFLFTFSENPNVISAIGTYTSVNTTTIPGQSDLVQEFDVNSIDGFDSGNWSLSGNTITFTDNNNEESFAEIVEYSGTKLILKAVVNEEQDISGVSVKISGEMLLTLEK